MKKKKETPFAELEMSEDYSYLGVDCGRLSDDLFERSFDDYEKVLVPKMRVVHAEAPDRVFLRTQGRSFGMTGF